MKAYSLRVVDIRHETRDSLTILFKQPGLKRIKYLAGQYLSLIFRINGRRYIRPYSFSSAPGVDETLNITVKRVPGGIVSNHIIDRLKVDDIIEVMEPLGDFVLSDHLNPEMDHIYLWGAGSGITPLISIAKYALYHNKAKRVTLAYGNRHFDDVIFKSDIKELEGNFKGVFLANHFITRPFIDEYNPYVIQGRIAAGDVKRIVDENEGFVNISYHYICGPAGLKETVKSVLTEFNVDAHRVFSEDFEVIRNPQDFENIHTQNVLIVKDGASTQVEVPSGKSILEAGLDALIDLSYSCQTGNCLLCKGRVVNGKIKMIGIEKLPEELGAEDCLLCSSFPLTGDVEIVIN